VTASDKSIVNLWRQVARITERPLTKLFLFTTPVRLFREGPLAPVWYAQQHAFDHALLRYSVKALHAAMPHVHSCQRGTHWHNPFVGRSSHGGLAP
jgi:hypothetical protein